jgi:UDP-N-acetylmuramoyl-tripeptide--D-alanyl-D-alanine ligase
MFQIEEYEIPRLFAWGQQKSWLAHRATLVGATLSLVGGLVSLSLSSSQSIVTALGLLAGSGAMHVLWGWISPKKELVLTPRMKRILGATAFFVILAAILLAVTFMYVTPFTVAIIGAVIFLLSPILSILFIVLGNITMLPVEAQVRRGFIRRAKNRINQYQPQVVGIAGSYGKTSTKHITAQLLNTQITTLPTPKSFNTLMGVTRTINENLEPHHKVFLVEMDAYGPGEINSMCTLVNPSIAVITSVGPQHLERFGTIDRIGDALYELVAALPKGSTALIYCGDKDTARLADRAAQDGHQVICYGLSSDTIHPLDVVATDIVVDAHATSFTWCWQAKGLEQRVNIPLLGQHNNCCYSCCTSPWTVTNRCGRGGK